jgi:hypothetical protein
MNDDDPNLLVFGLWCVVFWFVVVYAVTQLLIYLGVIV